MRKYITKASERIGVESTSRDGKRAQVVSYSTCENFIIVKERIEGGANEKAVWRLFINCPFVCINFDFFWLNKARQLYMDF